MFGKKSDNKLCPMLNKPCIGSDCMWATTVRGTDPNTGSEIDNEACAIVWLPTLLVENAKVGNQTGAAVESLRNVVDEANRAPQLINPNNPMLR